MGPREEQLRQLRRSLPVLLAAAAIAAAGSGALSGCGGSSKAASTTDAVDTIQLRERQAVEGAVRAKHLPPIALQMFKADGTIQSDFIDGATFNHDVIRTRDHGLKGPKLAWDLNGDGHISHSERTITEEQLYDAAHRYFPANVAPATTGG
jgi:hypothetical protein